MNDSNEAIWLRRSRLVAREYTGLQPERESLFSPTTSSLASRILAICFLAMREHQDCIMASIDVKDAFLTVKQEVDTRVTCKDANGNSVQYSLGRVLSGQRDGSLLWYGDLAKFVKECSLEMTELDAYPSILRSKNGDCLFSVLVHFVLQGSSLFLFPLWLKDFRMFNIFVFPPPLTCCMLFLVIWSLILFHSRCSFQHCIFKCMPGIRLDDKVIIQICNYIVRLFVERLRHAYLAASYAFTGPPGPYFHATVINPNWK